MSANLETLIAWDEAAQAYAAAEIACSRTGDDDDATDRAADVASAAMARVIETPAPTYVALLQKLRIFRHDTLESTHLESIAADVRLLQAHAQERANDLDLAHEAISCALATLAALRDGALLDQLPEDPRARERHNNGHWLLNMLHTRLQQIQDQLEEVEQ